MRDEEIFKGVFDHQLLLLAAVSWHGCHVAGETGVLQADATAAQRSATAAGRQQSPVLPLGRGGAGIHRSENACAYRQNSRLACVFMK